MSLIKPQGKFPTIVSSKRKHLEPSELAAVFNVLKDDPFWYGYFRLQYHYGCRVGEPRLVLQEEVDFKSKRIALRRLKKRKRALKAIHEEVQLEDGTTKRKRRLVVDETVPEGPGFELLEYPLPDSLAEVLKAVPQMPGSPWFFTLVDPSKRNAKYGTNRYAQLGRTEGDWTSVSREYAMRVFKRAAKKAGLPSKLQHTHTLRHSRATHLLAAGVPAREVQYLLAHSDIKITEGYIGLALAMKVQFDQGAIMREDEWLKEG